MDGRNVKKRESIVVLFNNFQRQSYSSKCSEYNREHFLEIDAYLRFLQRSQNTPSYVPSAEKAALLCKCDTPLEILLHGLTENKFISCMRRHNKHTASASHCDSCASSIIALGLGSQIHNVPCNSMDQKCNFLECSCTATKKAFLISSHHFVSFL